MQVPYKTTSSSGDTKAHLVRPKKVNSNYNDLYDLELTRVPDYQKMEDPEKPRPRKSLAKSLTKSLHKSIANIIGTYKPPEMNETFANSPPATNSEESALSLDQSRKKEDEGESLDNSKLTTSENVELILDSDSRAEVGEESLDPDQLIKTEDSGESIEQSQPQPQDRDVSLDSFTMDQSSTDTQ